MSSQGTKPARNNPKRETNLQEKYQTTGNATTVMIRNIPDAYNQDELLQEVCEVMGSSHLLDFFYLPWDTQNDRNLGYAFVNFLNPSLAAESVRLFSNYKFRIHQSTRMGKVLAAHIQGLENNLRHLEDRAVVLGNHPCAPIVMWRGNKIELSTIFQELRTQDTLRKFEAGGHSQSDSSTTQEFAKLLDKAAGLTPGTGQQCGQQYNRAIGPPGLTQSVGYDFSPKGMSPTMQQQLQPPGSLGAPPGHFTQPQRNDFSVPVVCPSSTPGMMQSALQDMPGGMMPHGGPQSDCSPGAQSFLGSQSSPLEVAFHDEMPDPNFQGFMPVDQLGYVNSPMNKPHAADTGLLLERLDQRQFGFCSPPASNLSCHLNAPPLSGNGQDAGPHNMMGNQYFDAGAFSGPDSMAHCSGSGTMERQNMMNAMLRSPPVSASGDPGGLNLRMQACFAASAPASSPEEQRQNMMMNTLPRSPPVSPSGDPGLNLGMASAAPTAADEQRNSWTDAGAARPAFFAKVVSEISLKTADELLDDKFRLKFGD